MKPIRAFAAALVFAALSFAQHSQHAMSGQPAATSRPQPAARPQAAPATSGTHLVYPSGGITFPATGSNSFAPVSPFSITNPGFASSLGATVAGRGGNPGYHRYRRGPVGYYAYPVYVGGYADYGYGGYADNGYQGGYAPEPYGAVQTPQVIINQNFLPEHATPVMRDYTGESPGDVRVYDAPGREPLEPSADETNYYLIAFKDHSIYSAFAYWVDGDTLHYVTAQRVHNQASLALVDRELTDKLNRDRMQVKLPK